MKDNRKIFRPLSMENYFKANSPNPFLDGRQDVDYYRKVGDKPEVVPRVPILNLEPQMVDPEVGIIKVTTNPIGGNFYLVQNSNEINLGTTTDQGLTVTDIPTGTYNYIIKKTDFQDYKNQITVLPNEVCCVQVDLKSAQKSETCQPLVSPQPTPAPSQGASGFFITDRDILKGVGIFALALLIGYILWGRYKE